MNAVRRTAPGARFPGLPVSPGTGAGVLALAGGADSPADLTAATSAVTPEDVAAAFTAVAAERTALAARLRDSGRDAEADIIEIGALIAADPALSELTAAAVRGGADAVTAVRAVTERHAAAMARLDNPVLAERAGDIRQVGDAVASHLTAAPLSAAGRFTVPPGDQAFILVRREVSPADLIELAEAGLAAAVSVTGGASSHAAIIARGLGIPMITGVDPAVLALTPGDHAVVEAAADAGELRLGVVRPPSFSSLPRPVLPATAEPFPGPARTRDGREITVLANVASELETRRALAGGADGVGLLRTEIPYVRADAWPGYAGQRAQLGPILGLLAGRTAVVRLLDFSGDKVPPFLAGQAGGTGAGLAALLSHPTALTDQLRAALDAGRDAGLALLVPMVSTLDEVARVREALTAAAAGLGLAPPPLGIMVELESTAAGAAGFAPAVDFFSIGTNDLTGDVLGLGRRDQAAAPALAAHPRVLALIQGVVAAARGAGISVSVCGDAAGEPKVLPLLAGLGVPTVSVSAARVAGVRSWIRKLDAGQCADLAGRALRASSPAEVWDLVPRL
jgi:phosphoenolpyruvate-protein kinase (PTS system EI component)